METGGQLRDTTDVHARDDRTWFCSFQMVEERIERCFPVSVNKTWYSLMWGMRVSENDVRFKCVQ